MRASPMPAHPSLDRALPDVGARAGPFSRSRRRIHWLSLPLDYGPAGRTQTSTWRHALDAIIGRDKDTEASLAALP